jgi:hypothetical protein
MNFVRNCFLTEILMMLFLFYFASIAVILQIVVVTVVKEYAIIVAQSLIFLKNEMHNASTF